MSLTRRSFRTLSALLPCALQTAASRSIPIGLELYSVRDALKHDPEGTVRSVAKMGYECVEFYAPYFEWSEAQAKQMRKLLDDLGLRCFSTHNDEHYFDADKINHARDLNLVLGSKNLVMASADLRKGTDSWKLPAELLNTAAEKGGRIEFYLLEQEGSRFSELETANRCLQSLRTTHA